MLAYKTDLHLSDCFGKEDPVLKPKKYGIFPGNYNILVKHITKLSLLKNKNFNLRDKISQNLCALLIIDSIFVIFISVLTWIVK